MDLKKIFEFYKIRHGGINGAIAGFIITISILLFGLFKVIFVVAGVLVGYFIGNYIVHEKDYVNAIFEKILPPRLRK